MRSPVCAPPQSEGACALCKGRAGAFPFCAAGFLKKSLTKRPVYIIINHDENPIVEVLVMVLKVCVGSSCHLRGSYDVIEEMKRLIKKYGVEDKVDLQATFCVGNCTNGVSVLADEVLLHNANKDNCEELFLTQVYPLLNA